MSVEKRQFLFLLILASVALLGTAIGLTLAIVGAVIYKNGFWALFAIFCYIMTPVPAILSRLFSQGGKDGFGVEDEGTGFIEHYGAFLTSFLATIGLGVLILLAHSQVISWKTFAFEISGGAVILFTLLSVYGVFVGLRNKINDDSY